jgi:dTDP-4-amino-4,6-dideoxygalactose transaminase
MSSPDLTQADIDAVNAVLQTPILGIGPQIQAFQKGVFCGLAN